MRPIFLFLLTLIFQTPFYGQNSSGPDLRGDYTVISTTGLNLRDAPGLNTRVIKKLAFGTKVEVIENRSFKVDTIGKNIVFYEGKKVEQDIIGNWVKVKCQNQEGFLFDSYLGTLANLEPLKHFDSEQNLNKEYVLLFPENDCNNNFWPVKDMNWIGCYKDGAQLKLRKIELKYYIGWNDYKDPFMADYGRSSIISTSDNKDLLFVIGSKKKLREGTVTGSHELNWIHNFEEFENFKVLNEFDPPSLVLTSSSKKQVLNNTHIKANYAFPSRVVWEGDLDNDGILDYIIHYGEKSSRIYLYLSSEASEGEIVKPVAVYFSGYCC